MGEWRWNYSRRGSKTAAAKDCVAEMIEATAFARKTNAGDHVNEIRLAKQLECGIHFSSRSPDRNSREWLTGPSAHQRIADAIEKRSPAQGGKVVEYSIRFFFEHSRTFGR